MRLSRVFLLNKAKIQLRKNQRDWGRLVEASEFLFQMNHGDTLEGGIPQSLRGI